VNGTIVIVEDDESIRAMLCYYFKSAGYEARDYASAEALLEARPDAPALYILDVMLPGMDGLALLGRLRAAGDGAPVIFLTARAAEMDRVNGLEAGADDYVVKPFSLMELQARVNAVLRRVRKTPPLTRGDLTLDPAAHIVKKGGETVELTRKEFALLRLLLSRRGEALTRGEILRAVWGYDYAGETRTVDMHIRSLRQKLGEDLIGTVRGVGYRIE